MCYPFHYVCIKCFRFQVIVLLMVDLLSSLLLIKTTVHMMFLQFHNG